MSPAFVLTTPWALFQRDDRLAGIGRRRLSPNTVVRIPAGMPITLAVDPKSKVKVSGYKMAAQLFGSPFALGESRYQLYQISVGTRPNENRLEIEVDEELAGSIEIVGFFPRPAWSGGRYGGGATSFASEQLDELLLSLVDLIRNADDPKYVHHQIFWDRLTYAWDDEEAEAEIPPMALIVRHAETLRSLVLDLSERPRRILSRTRNLTPVDRVQQLDVTCIRWLSRQPGRDVYERAGPRQRVLAVRRYESSDTLENRVLRDYCLRSEAVARGYTGRYKKLSNSQRWQVVRSYGRECDETNRALGLSGIAKLQPPAIPNYVLMHDARYRRLWVAYLEILRRLDEEDECWRWQHRLWNDFGRLMMQAAIRRDESYEVIAESPLRIAPEQVRGNWSVIDAQSGVWTTTTELSGEVVISMVWDTGATHSKLPSWISGLGAGAVLHVQRLDDDKEVYIVVWNVHHFSDDAPGLSTVADSAKKALAACSSSMSLIEDRELRLAGLLLMSDFDFASRNEEDWRIRLAPVIGYRFGPSFGTRKRILDRIPTAIKTLIDDAFTERPERESDV